jgi:hypothetical protein
MSRSVVERQRSSNCPVRRSGPLALGQQASFWVSAGVVAHVRAQHRGGVDLCLKRWRRSRITSPSTRTVSTRLANRRRRPGFGGSGRATRHCAGDHRLRRKGVRHINSGGAPSPDTLVRGGFGPAQHKCMRRLVFKPHESKRGDRREAFLEMEERHD